MLLANALSVRTVRSVMFVSVNDWLRPGSSSAHMASRLHAPAPPLGRSQPCALGISSKRQAGVPGPWRGRLPAGATTSLKRVWNFSAGFLEIGEKRGFVGSEPSTAQAFHGPSLGLRPGRSGRDASYPPYRNPMSSAGEERGGGGDARGGLACRVH